MADNYEAPTQAITPEETKRQRVRRAGEWLAGKAEKTARVGTASLAVFALAACGAGETADAEPKSAETKQAIPQSLEDMPSYKLRQEYLKDLEESLTPISADVTAEELLAAVDAYINDSEFEGQPKILDRKDRKDGYNALALDHAYWEQVSLIDAHRVINEQVTQVFDDTFLVPEKDRGSGLKNLVGVRDTVKNDITEALLDENAVVIDLGQEYSNIQTLAAYDDSMTISATISESDGDGELYGRFNRVVTVVTDDNDETIFRIQDVVDTDAVKFK